MSKCLEVHLRFSHFITYNSLKTFAISRLNVFEIDELWSWWNQVAIRPKEGGIYGNPVNGNNQIVCEQAHSSKPWVKFGWGGINFPCTPPKFSLNSHK